MHSLIAGIFFDVTPKSQEVIKVSPDLKQMVQRTKDDTAYVICILDCWYRA